MFLNNKSIIESCIQWPDLPKKDGDILYVHPDLLGDFVKGIDSINFTFVLVTCGSDTIIPYGVFEEAKTILYSEKVICWYAQNAMVTFSKLRNLPIGIDYHTDKTKTIEEQNKLLVKVLEETKGREKINKIYGNFHFQMNITFVHDRQEAMDQIPANLIDYEKERLPKEECYRKMASYKYIASPFGNGMECHRTWEALCLGCIPILKSSCMNKLYEGLPVLIVDSWSSVSKEVLDSFENKNWNYEKLTAEYWINEIKQAGKSNLFNYVSKEVVDSILYPHCSFEDDK